MTPEETDRPERSETGADSGATGESAGGATGEATATARAAERQAAIAAAEGFHPLRVRPYVSEPGAEPVESAGKRPAGQDVTSRDADGAHTGDLGAFGPAGDADGDTAFVSHLGSGAGVEYAAAPAGVPASGRPRGGHRRQRRRRRGAAVAAVAISATAVAASAVAMANQLLGTAHRPERSLPDLVTSAPDVELPPDADPTSAATSSRAPGDAVTVASASPSVPSTPSTPSPSSPSATRTPTGTPAASVSTFVPAPSTPARPDPTSAGATAPPASSTVTSPPTQNPPLAAPTTLAMGDTGAQVQDLQQRLRRAYVYWGDTDGRFDAQVQQAVALFQFWNAIDGDPEGVYGPQTRAVLERQTSW